MAKKTVTVRYLPDHTYSQLLVAGTHSYVSDEPEAAGGDGLGPAPYELLLWALGSCTAMTLLMYARNKGWDLAGISVQLTHERIPADQDDGTAKVEVIQQDISLRGELSEEQRERLLAIAERCPIHKTLLNPPRVISHIAATG